MTLEKWFGLNGKIAVVTGGSRGLGRSMALALAEAGADVALTGRTQATLESTAAEIKAKGRKAWTFMADMADPELCQSTLETIVNDLGTPDILINNVGNREVNVQLEDQTLDVWQNMIDLNLTSCFLGTKIVGAAMIKDNKRGRIINIGSINALISNRGTGGRHYETAKAAVVQLTRAAAADWAASGITVNAICPGLFMTDANKWWQKEHPEVITSILENIPMARAGEPDEIGPLAVYLASDSSSYVTGASYFIDGGYTLW